LRIAHAVFSRQARQERKGKRSTSRQGREKGELG
jgi:hypothetical protein